MTLSDFLSAADASLSGLYPRQEARAIARILCGEIIGLEPYRLISDPDLVIGQDDAGALDSALARLAEGEPLQYVLGHTEFCGIDIKVGPGLLIPRPETELLVQEALKHLRSGCRALDLCTGTGCIAWALALKVPGAEVTGIDISERAVSMAGDQCVWVEEGSCGVRRPVFLRRDIFDFDVDFAEGSFDVITSNPPYVMESEKAQMRRNVLDYEPDSAIFVTDGDPLVFYRAIARWSALLLRPGGFGITEINEKLGDGTAQIFRDASFCDVALLKDLAGRDRFVTYRKNNY